MIKVFARTSLAPSLLSLRTSFSNSSESGGLVPMTIDNTDKFYRNVYGIEMKRHILPYNSQNFPWSADQMKDYRKKVPNYVVVLVNKVIDEANEINIGEEFKEKESIDKFYEIATYCKINYMKKYTQIQALYRVKIRKIEALSEDQEEHPKIVESEENFNEVEDVEDDLNDANSEENAPKQLVFSTPQRKINLKLYSLEVDLLEEPYLKLDHHKEIQLKFMIETYKMFFPSYSKNKFWLFNPSEALRNIYIVAQQMSNQNSKIKQIQQILEENEADKKMNLIQQIMNKTLDWKTIYKNIEKIAESNLRNKKFYEYYSEILKIAKQSIEGKKGKELFLENVTKRFNEKKPPTHVKEVFNQQKEKYALMDQTAVEAAVSKKYLQDLSMIPYSVKSDQIYQLQFAENTLNEEHYGMREVKESILEIIAVGKLKGSLKGKIFCLIGGPGLGKTTIAKSIAKALGRKYFSISLGGVTDSSVLKGHRRTYIGAYAGKIIEALKECQTNNPVILLDEIDKMGSSYQGDPRSELLQILDPNQNQSFVDNFLDVPIDLSNVLFICSANYERNISKPLIDRMEKIKLHSYTDDQKRQIFKAHLLRRAIDRSGVQPNQFVLNPDILQSLIYDYSEGEPGVRRLQKNIVQILEKVAYKIVEGVEPLPITISKINLKEYLGNNYFKHRDHNNLHMGVAISLGGGQYGSRLTYIQSFKKSFAGKKGQPRAVMFTGSLGDIFKEAMNISYTFARNFLANDINNYFLFENQIHIHALDGAAKKDGSMDSLTICTTLVSLALQKKVKAGFAMTGEITLHGKILRTHGIKEKVLLAKREKIPNLILPVQNQPDVEMLASNVKEGLNIHFVSDFRDVYQLLFDSPIPTSIPKSLETEQFPQKLDRVELL